MKLRVCQGSRCGGAPSSLPITDRHEEQIVGGGAYVACVWLSSYVQKRSGVGAATPASSLIPAACVWFFYFQPVVPEPSRAERSGCIISNGTETSTWRIYDGREALNNCRGNLFVISTTVCFSSACTTWGDRKIRATAALLGAPMCAWEAFFTHSGVRSHGAWVYFEWLLLD